MLTVVVPLLAWAVAALIVALAIRYLRNTLPRLAPGTRTPAGGPLRNVALPTAAYLLPAATLLAATPIGALRHFYPDVGWALTVAAYLAIGWGSIRAMIATTAWARRRH